MLEVAMAGGGTAALATVIRERGGGEQQSQDDGGGGDTAETAEPASEPLDPRIRHIGEAIAMVCRYEQAQVVWSARIPLDPELLPETVLFVTYSPGFLELRFETSCWEVRELLSAQLAMLRSLVAEQLSGACNVAITF